MFNQLQLIKVTCVCSEKYETEAGLIEMYLIKVNHYV